MAYHEGEHAVQLRAGWNRDNWGSAGVSPEIPPIGVDFLRHQRMMFIGALDSNDAPWATILTGPPGFAHASGGRTVIVGAHPGDDDPLADALAADTEVGMLAIEPQTRRRMRINGRSHRTSSGLVVTTDQVYSNCPKYIQVRQLHPEQENPAPARSYRGAELSNAQQHWVTEADTFLVATSAPGHGVDLSHRGGNPGVVAVVGPRRLIWPDYVGNSMYMTLGNLELVPRCGLLFLDWARGHALHLTGRATIDWDAHHAAAFPAAERLIDFTVDDVVQIDHASPLRWELVEYFRHNPPTATRHDERSRV